MIAHAPVVLDIAGTTLTAVDRKRLRHPLITGGLILFARHWQHQQPGLQHAAADGHSQPSPDSEQRRLALLPQTPPLAWDELMHDSVHQRALERLP